MLVLILLKLVLRSSIQNTSSSVCKHIDLASYWLENLRIRRIKVEVFGCNMWFYCISCLFFILLAFPFWNLIGPAVKFFSISVCLPFFLSPLNGWWKLNEDKVESCSHMFDSSYRILENSDHISYNRSLVELFFILILISIVIHYPLVIA